MPSSGDTPFTFSDIVRSLHAGEDIGGTGRRLFTATYAQPGGMRAGFAQFTAFSQDAKDNKVFEQTKLTMPVLAVGGEKSFGALQAVIMRHVATNVQEAVVKGSGHWLMEERPAETVVLIRSFLETASQKSAQ